VIKITANVLSFVKCVKESLPVFNLNSYIDPNYLD